MSGKLALVAIALLAGSAPALAHDLPAPAPTESAPITIGTTHRVAFAPGDMREVNVYLPPDYDGETPLPVLYLLDGGLDQDFLHVAGTSALNALWGRSQPVIVVGIQTKDRRAELIGSRGTDEEQGLYPTAGNAGAFRAFLRDTVKPLVEANYRTSGDDAVIGESLAGLFIVETWIGEPALFDRYAAINPSLWWDDQALARFAAAAAVDGQNRGQILISYSNEGPETQTAVEMVADAALELGCLVPRADLTHATAYHILTPSVLQWLFPTGYEFEPEWGFDTGCAQG